LDILNKIIILAVPEGIATGTWSIILIRLCVSLWTWWTRMYHATIDYKEKWIAKGLLIWTPETLQNGRTWPAPFKSAGIFSLLGM